MTTQQKTDYIFIQDKNPTADIAIVFGTSKTVDEAVEKAYELYSKKAVPKILVTGGLNKSTGTVESEILKQNLTKKGVRPNDIIVENKSTNSYENALFSLRVLNNEIGLDKIKQIVAVVRNYHARRSLMTLKKVFPNNIILKAAPYESKHYPFNQNNWYKSKLGFEKVEEEISKIKTYLAKGHLQKLDTK